MSMHSHTSEGASGSTGGSTEGKIRCIFLSEFHATAGCKISCQVCFVIVVVVVFVVIAI